MTDNTEPVSQQTAGQQAAPQQLIRAPHYRSVYANNVGFSLTNGDFTFLFASNIPGTNVQQEEASVTLPLTALKIISEALPAIVKALETEIGAIRVPKVTRTSNQQMIDALLGGVRKANLVE